MEFLYNMIDSNISFTSNFNFVSKRAFEKIASASDTCIDYGVYGINPYFCTKTGLFRTEKVRTCIAGGIKAENHGKKNMVGFHLLDNKNNWKNIDKIYKQLALLLFDTPKRAFIIGSKCYSDYDTLNSYILVKNMKDYLNQVIKNVTIFEPHTRGSAESNIHYSALTDTWTINTQYYDCLSGKFKSVLSKKDLLENFLNISIADGDKLFIRGKEIKL
jgi:hypothetical protein